MTAVSTITPHLKNLRCPDALRGLKSWLTWRYEADPKRPEGKPRKVPYYAGGGRRRGVQGSVDDRERMVTFDEACAAAARKGFAGVGLALMPELGIVALDFDRCVGPEGLRPDVEALVVGTYAEYSPSGQGLRAFMRGDLGDHKAGGEPYGFETFNRKGFVTFTGQVAEVTQLLGAENTLAPVSPEVRALARQRFGTHAGPSPEHDDDPLMSHEPAVGLSPAQLEEILDALEPDCSHDEWLQVGMALHHETDGEGFELWHAWSAQGSKYPGEDELALRWASFGRESGRPVTARYLLKLGKAAGVKLATGGVSLDEFDDVSGEVAQPPSADGVDEKPRSRFEVVPASQFSQGAAPEWIIKGVLPRADLVVLYGESGAGKSFMALDMAAAIARGEAWRGLRTRRLRVVYVAAEGGGGFRSRLKAYAQQHGIDLADVDLGVVHAAPNLLLKPEALELAKAIVEAGGADLVILDTWAQVTPGGNENSAEDMGRALAHCKGLTRATGATVVLVHHAGKDTSKGARGWSGLRAAADAELEVVRSPEGRLLRVTKQKDGDDQGAWGFELQTVGVGVDADGDVVESCVVAPAEVPVVQVAGRGRPVASGRWQTLLAEVVSEWALAQSRMAVADVLAECLRRAPAPEDGKRDTRKQHLKRALQDMSAGDDAPYYIEDDYLEVL